MRKLLPGLSKIVFPTGCNAGDPIAYRIVDKTGFVTCPYCYMVTRTTSKADHLNNSHQLRICTLCETHIPPSGIEEHHEAEHICHLCWGEVVNLAEHTIDVHTCVHCNSVFEDPQKHLQMQPCFLCQAKEIEVLMSACLLQNHLTSHHELQLLVGVVCSICCVLI